MSNSDLSAITSEVIRSSLRETVEKKLKSKKYKISVSSASQAGANNFMGTVYRVSFNKEDGDESERNTIHKLIVKVAPVHLARREQFFSRPSFLREIYMYEKVSTIKILIMEISFGKILIAWKFSIGIAIFSPV